MGIMASETTFDPWKVVFSWGKMRKTRFSQKPLNFRFSSFGFLIYTLSKKIHCDRFILAHSMFLPLVNRYKKVLPLFLEREHASWKPLDVFINSANFDCWLGPLRLVSRFSALDVLSLHTLWGALHTISIFSSSSFWAEGRGSYQKNI